MFHSSTLMQRLALASLLVGLSTAAHAHPGHGTHSLWAGLVHPLGLDHLLAMVAVGVWSVLALPAAKAWWGPATFVGVMLGGAALGLSGLWLPYLEHALALSVVLFGALLILARAALPLWAGLGLVAAAAALHGLAHGAATPTSGVVAYALGFVLSTAALHATGVGMGLAIRRWMAQRSGLALTGLGATLGVTGLALVAQV